MKRWERIKKELEGIETERKILRDDLKYLQSKCSHGSLPAREPGEEYCDTCPDCGYVAYRYAIA